MGAGLHGGFGETKGYQQKQRKPIFKLVQFKGSVKVNGEIKDVTRKVYQRNDINFEYVDPLTGISNIERMQAGNAPLGNDGNPIQLHHILQKEKGSVVEIREITHHEYYKILHGLVCNGESFRNDPVLKKQFNNFRSTYWKWRAKEYLGGKNKI